MNWISAPSTNRASASSRTEQKSMERGRKDFGLYAQSPLAFEVCLKAVRWILRQEQFEVVSEVLLHEKLCESRGQERQRLTVLVVWSATYASQALSIDRDAGLLMPFCLAVIEDGTHSIVATAHRARLAVDKSSVGIRVLTRVLDDKIMQVFLQLCTHDSAREAVIQGGGSYRGIQHGSPERGIPDLVLFNDPVTNTTLALVFDGSPVSCEAVKAKIRDSRKVFDEAGRMPDENAEPARRSRLGSGAAQLLPVV